MTEAKSLNVLKNAILLEKRGKTLYESFAKHSSNEDVKEFFNMMAKEEEKHIDILSQQFKNYENSGSFLNLKLDENNNTSARILTDKIVSAIGSAGFEAAAISAAINMEQKAVIIYGEQAKSTKDPDEKKLYEWLSEWENTHLEYLQAIDLRLKENIWFDNHFWPM